MFRFRSIDRISKGRGLFHPLNAACVPLSTPPRSPFFRPSPRAVQRVAASEVFSKLGLGAPAAGAGGKSKADKDALIEDVRQALYCSKICSYAQASDAALKGVGH